MFHNHFEKEKKVVRIYFRNRKGELNGVFMKIDAEDFDRVIIHKWSAVEGKYATTKWGEKRIAAHNLILGRDPARVVLDYESGIEVDHINRDRLDNRKENLRIVRRIFNKRNRRQKITASSGVVGVKKDGDGFIARIYDKKEIYLGRYKTVEEAIAARREAEKALGYNM